MMRWQQFAIAGFVACTTPSRSHRPVVKMLPVPMFVAQASTVSNTNIKASYERIPDVRCPDALLRIDDGVVRGSICESQIARPYVAVDLGPEWTPRLFDVQADGRAPDFRRTYLQLANEVDADGKPLAPNDGLAELYGILPSLAVVRARLADEARHACHAAIDSSAIAAIDKPLGQDHGGLVANDNANRRYLSHLLERARIAKKLPADPTHAWAKTDRRYAWHEKTWRRVDAQYRGIVAAQQHLVCEGLLRPQDADGSMTWRTGVALEMFQRRNFLMPNNRLDEETRAALATDSRELDFRFALRVLRERVVDATGLIEDGTAGAGPQPILGRMLDPKPMQAARGASALALPEPAPDLIAAATEAAAKHLGWTDPQKVLAFLARYAKGIRVALALPPAPAYHEPHMELSAVIDRGDVYYDDRPIPRIPQRRPNLVLYVDDHGTKRALVRWPTTIGGWADVIMPGGWVAQKWKESDVGPRVWRDLYAAPTWLPPKTTPDRDLVKPLWDGRYELKRSIMGPGPRAAFGMVLLPHLNPVKRRDGTETFWDNGIGTHGSASVTSIVNGTSHGCHRLYNQLAVRLGDFLLRHRDHVVKGQQPEFWRRLVRYRGRQFMATVDTRGFLYEMTPPIPVEVTKGTIRTARKTPPLSSAPARP